MKALFAKLAQEPALVVAVILAIINTFVSINADQALGLTTIIEALLTLVAGAVVRSQVKPLSKLPLEMQTSEDDSLPASGRG